MRLVMAVRRVHVRATTRMRRAAEATGERLDRAAWPRTDSRPASSVPFWTASTHRRGIGIAHLLGSTGQASTVTF